MLEEPFEGRDGRLGVPREVDVEPVCIAINMRYDQRRRTKRYNDDWKGVWGTYIHAPAGRQDGDIATNSSKRANSTMTGVGILVGVLPGIPCDIENVLQRTCQRISP